MMPRINLSKIHFRPYDQGEEPTTFGPDDYTSVPGVIDLSTIRFRAWEDNGYSSLGGSGFNDPQPPSVPGDGTGGTPIDPGEFVMIFNAAGSDVYVAKNTSPSFALYARADFYMSSAQLAAMNTGVGNFRGQILDISRDSTELGFWQAIFLDRRNPSNVQDGNMYLHDYWSPNSARKLVTADVWHVMEVAMRSGGGTLWEFNFKLDDVESTAGWLSFDMGMSDPLGIVFAGATFNDATVSSQYYIDNVSYATDDWLSDSGTPEFYDDFETGNFSNWDITQGSPTLAAPPG